MNTGGDTNIQSIVEPIGKEKYAAKHVCKHIDIFFMFFRFFPPLGFFPLLRSGFRNR